MIASAADVDAVTPALIRRFAVTVGLDLADPVPGGAAPFGLHWCLAPDAAPLADLAADGLARTGAAIMPPPEGFDHTLWAGADVTILAPLRVCDTVRRRTRVLDVAEKTGRSGRLAFGRVEQVFSVDGEDRIVDVQRYVFRPAGASAEPRSGQASGAAGDPLGSFRIDPIAVVRFSALTFNAHRIHWDTPYAREGEGFPAPLVQGTLTATLLGLRWEGRGGEATGTISFHAHAPAFCGEVLTFAAHGGERDRWFEACTSDGRRVMSARVRAAGS